MKTLMIALAVLMIGCDSAPVDNTPVLAGTCVNSAQQVVEDYKCDTNWIAQQRAIAEQRHDQALLDSLIIYHMLYTPNPYSVGAYIPRSGVVVYSSPPRGYTVQNRTTYVTNVTNHTIVNGRVASNTYSKTSQQNSYQPTQKTNPSTTTRGGFGSSGGIRSSPPTRSSSSSSSNSSGRRR